MKGSATGVQSSAPHVFTVENGLIRRLRLFDEQDEALEAVGLGKRAE